MTTYNIKLDYSKSIFDSIKSEHPDLNLDHYDINVSGGHIILEKIKTEIELQPILEAIVKKNRDTFRLNPSAISTVLTLAESDVIVYDDTDFIEWMTDLIYTDLAYSCIDCDIGFDIRYKHTEFNSAVSVYIEFFDDDDKKYYVVPIADITNITKSFYKPILSSGYFSNFSTTPTLSGDITFRI